VCGGAARVRRRRDVLLILCGFGKDGRPATSMASRWVSIHFLIEMHDIGAEVSSCEATNQVLSSISIPLSWETQG
jgi:hypothetical protein